jgi:C4-dicarboxylate transporter DctM subunit
VSCRLSGAKMEDTVFWDIWLLVFMFMGLVLMIFFPEIVLWLPRVTGFL